ncbi:MAG: ACT domain-containing protein [Clostridia bacterium]|nr:ACT domain-containing protein [Clostridia bacterium]
MSVNQISVFLENKSGRLAAVTRILAENNVNIRALSIADTSDFGILRLIVDKPDVAFEVLKEEGFSVSLTEVIGVEMPDRPGGLAGVLDVLEKNNFNIEYLYAFIGRGDNGALVIFRVERLDEAVKCLEENGIKVVTGDRLYQL